MNGKTITLMPATIDNKNLMEDFITDFMGDFLQLTSRGNKRSYVFEMEAKYAPEKKSCIVLCEYELEENYIRFKNLDYMSMDSGWLDKDKLIRYFHTETMAGGENLFVEIENYQNGIEFRYYFVI